MTFPKQLTRNEFRDICLERDKHMCVVCGSKETLSVHHVVERKLWGISGGYYEENGATLCDECHFKAEQTLISCDDLRKACNIKRILLPDQFNEGEFIDKWGNYILPSGNRLKGELFYEEQVQKILGSISHLFVKYVKYPRTFHVPWSSGSRMKNENVISGMDHFKGKEVIVTEKVDGECTSCYNDYIHCRSMDSLSFHPSRTRIKTLWSEIKSDIPEGWRIVIENAFAKHTIHYKNLPDYHFVIGIWNEKNVCLSWDETVEWTELLGLQTVPVLYKGIYNEKLIQNCYKPISDRGDDMEGYVIRPASDFHYKDFNKSVLKYVGEKFCDHFSKNESDWNHHSMIRNELKNEKV